MRTEGYSILAAVALHGGLLLVAWAMPPLSLLQPADQRALRIIEIEIPTASPVEMTEPPPLPANVEPNRAGLQDRAPDARVARAVPAPVVGELPPPSSTAEPVSPQTNPDPAGTSTAPKFDDLPPDQRQGVLGGVPGVPGLGGPVWTMPGVLPGPAKAAAAPTVAPAPREVPRNIGDKVLGDAMAARDKDIGMDLLQAGSMATAARGAVLGSEIPTGTRGTIECRVSPSGVVSNCRLVSSTGGGSGAWDGAAKAAQAVAGTTLPGQYARGAIVTIDISVLQAPPAGSKGGFSGAGASFDVSNIGAHTTRQVRVSRHVVAVR